MSARGSHLLLEYVVIDLVVAGQGPRMRARGAAPMLVRPGLEHHGQALFGDPFRNSAIRGRPSDLAVLGAMISAVILLEQDDTQIIAQHCEI